ncbi:hypothetical protein GOP47_0016715 [Adiantum capillus-veneris]|uniref:GATA-type domain-containing protein n=1 Tax=Adiantum capillus-veneris TaxID=13818 RepID=A0A9D4UIB9_ADICA|nr:hypothetical protein GOP47_0016715 [Adiantum capillus-veneris]
MLPSSSSQLARYGHINHYKKFWLLQSTHLENQEQSSSSSTLSLGSSSSTAAPSGHAIKEISRTPSLVAQQMNGDTQHHAIIGPHYGICRIDMAATTSSSRGNNGCSAPTYCPNEPANLMSPYFTNTPGYGLQASSVTSLRRESGGPQLSLAVTCENVEFMKSVNCKWQPSSTPSLPQSNEQQQLVLHTSVAGASEETKFISSVEEKRVCNGTAAGTLSTASELHLRIGSQTHLGSALQCTNSSIYATTPTSGCPPSSGYLRTCTLCGTTRTPLWRSGPNGPKSLCNACGIRVKKTKRLEAALQATSGRSPLPSTMSAFKGALKRKLSSEAGQKDATFHKKKRSTSIFGSQNSLAKQIVAGHMSRKTGGLCDNGIPKVAKYSESGRSSANIFAEDVEEGAVLLMALSCSGLVLS